MLSSGLMRKKTFSRIEKGIVLVAALFLVASFSAAYAKSPYGTGFSSPDRATEALTAAIKADDIASLQRILGPGSKDIVVSGDPVADKEGRERFIKHYAEKHKLEQAGGKVTVYVGNDLKPFPIPLVKVGDLWRFDIEAGRHEILARRIGRNELNAIQVCLAYVDAQREYARMDPDGDGLHNYAMKFVSAPGKKDGLYWETRPGETQSPLGPLIAAARSEGYAARKKGDPSRPYHGYYFKILTRQGRHAADGESPYVVNGRMIGGFALVAYPAQWANSGIMTFIVNHDGIVYESNLGKDTAKIARAMDAFDPGMTWQAVK